MAPEKQDLSQHGPKPSSRSKAEDTVPPPAGMRKAVFALAEGDVTLTFPEGLSAESVEDLEGYIEILLRKVRRDAAKPAWIECRSTAHDQEAHNCKCPSPPESK